MADNKPTPTKQTRPVEAISRPQPKLDTGSPKVEASPAKPASATKPTKPTDKNKTLKVVLIVVGVLVLLSIIGSIVAGFAAKSLFEGGIKAVTGNEAKVDSKSGQVTVTSKDGKSTVSTEPKLPAGFPEDVPVYEPSTIRFSASLTKGSYNVTLSTNDSSDKVKGYYDKELKAEGWQMKENTQITFGSVTTTSYTKDKSELTVVITGDSDVSKSTAVSLSVKTN